MASSTGMGYLQIPYMKCPEIFKNINIMEWTLPLVWANYKIRFSIIN